MPGEDLMNQAPIGKPTKAVKGQRPPLDPAAAAAKSSVPAQRPTPLAAAAVTATTLEADPRFKKFQLVPIKRLAGSLFQHRDELNAMEDKEYQGLRASIEVSLNALPEGEVRTIEYVFQVMPDEQGGDQLLLSDGGHRRLQACHDLHVEEVYVWVKPFDKARMAIGTFQENKNRKGTNYLEDAGTFQDMMDTLGWNQTTIAKYLAIDGGQPHVSRCLAMLNYHPDLQRMIRLAGDRGMRAVIQLDLLREHFGIDKARELWAPLIGGFLTGDLRTDDIEQKVKALIGGESEKPAKTLQEELPELRLRTQAVNFHKKWQSFRKEIGVGPLSAELKGEIEKVYQEMGEILERSV